MVQHVRQADVDDLAARLGNRAIDVGEPARDVVPRGKRLRPLGLREYTAVTCASGTNRWYDSR